MGIAVTHIAYNGEVLKYARVSSITVDLATGQAAATLSGYKSQEDRLSGGDRYQVFVHQFSLPTPQPEDLLAYAYQVLSQEFPDLDWAEV
jgi:hypothetical protein